MKTKKSKASDHLPLMVLQVQTKVYNLQGQWLHTITMRMPLAVTPAYIHTIRYPHSAN